jgi:hypothetical protein
MSSKDRSSFASGKPWWRTAWGGFVAAVGFISAVLGIVGFVVPLLDGDGDDTPLVREVSPTSQPTAASPTETASPEPRIPAYRGAIGDLEDGEPFIAFIADHDGEVVRLDAELLVQDYTADPPAEVPVSFRVWNDCNHDTVPRDLPASECLGWEYDLAPPRTPDSSLYVGSGVHLEGWFGVQVRGNLHMGLNFVTLKPLTQERALEIAGR